jgi:APA family basic amino acid/polyamine antiporter
VFALWFQAAVSLVLLTTNTYDELLSFVVFADWLFFTFTAGAIFVVRRRGETGPDVVSVPGHPFTTGAFVLVAVGMVANSFFAYPTQSLVGSGILALGAVIYALIPAARRSRS